MFIVNLPEELKKEFVDPIDYTVANFGSIPYGGSSTAPIRLALPYNACTEIQNDDNYKNSKPFLLVERGDCFFVDKVINAQNAGAKMVIIIDNIEEETEYITMADNGRGEQITIPSILVSMDDGQRLFDLLFKNMELRDHYEEEIELTIDFFLEQTDSVELSLFITPPERKTFNLLFNLHNNYYMIQDTVKIVPIYNLYKLSEDLSFENYQQNCLENGLCTFDQDGDLPGTGADVVEEYIYQLCIQKLYGDRKWLQYTILQYEMCDQIPNYRFCRNGLYSELQIEQDKVDECSADDSIGEEQLRLMQEKFIYINPSAYINDYLYKGSFYDDDLVEAICAATLNPSIQCELLIEQAVKKFEQESILDYSQSQSESESSQESESEKSESEKSESESQNESQKSESGSEESVSEINQENSELSQSEDDSEFDNSQNEDLSIDSESQSESESEVQQEEQQESESENEFSDLYSESNEFEDSSDFFEDSEQEGGDNKIKIIHNDEP